MKINKIVSWLIILLMTVIVLFRIVTDRADAIWHWNYVGHVTDYGSRYLLLLLPVVAVGLYFLMEYYLKHPKKVNMTGVVVSDKNVAYVVKYLLMLRLTILVMVGYLAVCACGYLPFYALIVLLGIIAILVFFLKAKKQCKYIEKN